MNFKVRTKVHTNLFNVEKASYILLRSGYWTLVILNKGQTTIWEEIEIYSQENVYTIERLLVDKDIGLVNTE